MTFIYVDCGLFPSYAPLLGLRSLTFLQLILAYTETLLIRSGMRVKKIK